MLIASIDIGLINMSLCILDADEKIHHWCVFSIKSSSARDSYKKLFTYFDALPLLKDVSSVVIERQLNLNPKSRVIEGVVLAYFVIRNTDYGLDRKIIKYSAKYKLMIYKGPIPKFKVKDPYAIRKKTSIFITEQMLPLQDPKYAEILKKTKKKDDLADAFCMGIAYIRFVINKEKYYPPPASVQIINDSGSDSDTEVFES
jgi:hypothetical protein